ncbi:bifunctional glycosyltransferase family 2/GtrA family protein [Frankia sp. AvcI1]|uniref:bifunctional glycosyltransferase family 2/GtrA family protein n=2 Tax=Frankia sp. AvcI1 TaxID=573496 RepID=UPI00211929D3|nr:bifunctional glycosyltransferase family 2/GtrA family protein [Frankia sp. AvcI1]
MQSLTGAVAPRTSKPPALNLVEVMIPVYNEEAVLEKSVRRLHTYLTERYPYEWRITIVDNASTDRTLIVADRLAEELPRVQVRHLDVKGRGLALREAWSASDADIVCYMDVDLSTDLDAFLPLTAPLLSGHSEIAIGSRLRRGARVVRGPKREIISRCYNSLLRVFFRSSFRDAQCGFKAMRSDVARILLPAVRNDNWFFDTELLLLADRNRLRIHEVPVDWVDDPDSRVDVVATALEDLRGMWGVGLRILAGRGRVELPAELASARLPARMRAQLGPFAIIGTISTLSYVVLYALLRAVLSAFDANLLALCVTVVGNTWANRRFTFRRTGRQRWARQFVESAMVFGVGLIISSAALAILHLLWQTSGVLSEIVTVLASGVLATIVRFMLLRAWVFHPDRG